MSDAMPHAVLLDHLEERMNGRKLLAGVFLTFEFDPGFFELEILPVLLGVPVSQARPVRLVQLEDALRACAGRLAVYYDANRLVRSEAGSARLDVARIPMRVGSGAFHPKTLLLLVENPGTDGDEPRTQSLLVGALSANLTRSGWWENIEACHFEEIAEGESTRLREGLLGLLSELRRSSPDGAEPGAAAEIRAFLRRTGRRTWRVGGDRLLPHFLGGRESVPDFLERVAGSTLRGSCLEILSPYLDDAVESNPLEELIRRFQPAEVRVLLPRGRDGQAACRSELYESVRRLPNVRWGRLPAGGARWTQGHGGDERFVHAKLYRFFTRRPRREICLVGSVNLTRAAHQKGGNWESALLVEVDCPQAPEFWLALEDARPARFEHQEETTPSDTGGTPLMIRYHWGRNAAEAFWDADAASPVLTLKARDVERGQVGPLPPRRWVDLSPAWAEILAGMLRSETSFMEVSGHGDNPGLLLVQEEGMSRRPSAFLQLTVSDILRYWALLTVEQRMEFLEMRAPVAAGEGAEGAEHLARLQEAAAGETFFDRFAGSFHSFHCLERAVLELLEAGRKEQADYRLFGRKYDSLGTLLARTADDSTLEDDVHRYVVFLCARQLCQEVKRKHPEYWRERRAEARALEEDLARVAGVRARLAAGGEGMPGFLDWFDASFLKRAEPLEGAP